MGGNSSATSKMYAVSQNLYNERLNVVLVEVFTRPALIHGGVVMLRPGSSTAGVVGEV